MISAESASYGSCAVSLIGEYRIYVDDLLWLIYYCSMIEMIYEDRDLSDFWKFVQQFTVECKAFSAVPTALRSVG